MAPAEYQFSWHHHLLYSKLNDFAEGRIKRLIVEMPPGHGKSEGASRNLPSYLLGRNPNTRIIACSYTSDLSSEMNRDVQRILEGPRYASVFPGTRMGGSNVRSLSGMPRRNSDIFDVVGHRGYYKSAGVGGGITGRRFDYGLIDDPVKDRESANSPIQREALWRWYTGVFYTRQARGASILVVQTRWHEDDLTGRLLARMNTGEGEQWERLCLPAIAAGEMHPEDPRRPGEALWPWFRSLEDLEKQRSLDPRDFAALYQQDPVTEGDAEWPADWFTRGDFWFDTWPERLSVKTISIDPSKGRDARTGDYSAIVLYGVAADGTEYVEADLARRPADRICSDAARHAKVFTPDGLMLESNAWQDLLAPPLRAAMEVEKAEVSIHLAENMTPKPVRIRRLTGPLSQRKMRFRNTAGTRLLVSQLQQFPIGQYDDGPDALEMARRLAIDLWNGKGRGVMPKGYKA